MSVGLRGIASNISDISSSNDEDDGDDDEDDDELASEPTPVLSSVGCCCCVKNFFEASDFTFDITDADGGCGCRNSSSGIFLYSRFCR